MVSLIEDRLRPALTTQGELNGTKPSSQRTGLDDLIEGTLLPALAAAQVERTVVIKFDSSGLGLMCSSAVGSKGTGGVVICGALLGSPAANTAGLALGSRILSVNGTDVSDATLAELGPLLTQQAAAGMTEISLKLMGPEVAAQATSPSAPISEGLADNVRNESSPTPPVKTNNQVRSSGFRSLSSLSTLQAHTLTYFALPFTLPDPTDYL